jgi:hypothetical protein
VISFPTSLSFQRTQELYKQLPLSGKLKIQEMYREIQRTKEDNDPRNVMSRSPISVGDPLVLDGMSGAVLKSGVFQPADFSADSIGNLQANDLDSMDHEKEKLSESDSLVPVFNSDYKAPSSLGCGKDYLQCERRPGLQFSSVDEKRIPGIDSLKREGVHSLLWRHPRDYHTARNEDKAIFEKHENELFEQGRMIPRNSRVVIDHYYQPDSTKPYIPLIEID